MCAHDVTFVRHVCEDLGMEVSDAIPMYIDNSACITICKDLGVSSKNKHFERAIHYVREQVQNLRIKPVFVTTDKQMADIMTKPTDVNMFVNCQRYLLKCFRASGK